MRSLLFALGLFSILSACGSETGPEVASASGGRRTLAVIPKGTAHEFWQSVHAGALTAAQELGVDILWVAPQPEGDRAAQIDVVENCITKGVDGIVLMPVDRKSLARIAQEAKDEGIPVVIADSDLAWTGRVSYVATDNYRGGRLAGEKLVELLEGKGKVLMLRFSEGSASTDEREMGFLDAMGEVAGIEVISSNQYAGTSKESAQAVAENLLIAHQAIDGIFCSSESTAHGMLRALEDANRAGDVVFVGFDSSETLLAGLRSGSIDALVLQDPVRMGDLAVRTLIKFLDTGAADDRVDTGVVVATTANMDEAKIQSLLSPDLSILSR